MPNKRARVLITVKAAPEPSKTYVEPDPVWSCPGFPDFGLRSRG